MFNFGNDDKDKLKENMEQIKEMVNQGEGISEAEKASGDDETQARQPEEKGANGGNTEEDFPSSEDNFQGQPPENEGFQSQSQEGKGTQGFEEEDSTTGFPEEESGDIDRMEDRLKEDKNFDDQFGTPSQEAKKETPGKSSDSPENPQKRSKTTRSGMQDARDVERLSQEVPSPPESKEVDIPDIDRGPLFLRRQKFRRAKQMIDEMLYLTKEVEETVNTLEAGIQEDQRTERSIREMLKEFEDDRSKVEDIISPREE